MKAFPLDLTVRQDRDYGKGLVYLLPCFGVKEAYAPEDMLSLLRKWKRPNKRLRLLIERLFVDYQSERTMVRTFSRMRTAELSEMTEEECAALERHIRANIRELPPLYKTGHKKIKKLCQEIGWVTEDGQACEYMLNEFISRPSIPFRHKRFSQLHSGELSKLILYIGYVEGKDLLEIAWV